MVGGKPSTGPHLEDTVYMFDLTTEDKGGKTAVSFLDVE
jgi:hypothetical protein